jgi:proteasome activator subunit 4
MQGAARLLCVLPACLTAQHHPNKDIAAPAIATAETAAHLAVVLFPHIEGAASAVRVYAAVRRQLAAAEAAAGITEPHPWFPAPPAEGGAVASHTSLYGSDAGLDAGGLGDSGETHASALLGLLEHLVARSLKAGAGDGGGEADLADTAERAGAGSGGASLPSAEGSKGWSVRAAALKFTVPLRAHSLMLLSHADDERLLRLYVSRLGDSNFSAAEAAGKASVGVMMTLRPSLQAALGDAFVHATAIKLPRKVAPPASFVTSPPEQIAEYRLYRKRHARAVRGRLAGVLGASAVVGAHPFDVPPFLPGLLSALAKHVLDPQPIAGVVRDVFMGFKHTHTDNWEAHKAAFTPEQLSDLVDLLVSPTYYV